MIDTPRRSKNGDSYLAYGHGCAFNEPTCSARSEPERVEAD
ncbi:hypothetical protein [Moorena sp. SIO4G3]|nr:hypothetical protein [Moorena sp. SIO4G3]